MSDIRDLAKQGMDIHSVTDPEYQICDALLRALDEVGELQEEIQAAIEALGTDAMSRQGHLTLAENIAVTLREQMSIQRNKENGE